MLMMYIRRLMSVTAVTEAWSSLRAGKSFFGMTLDQYKQAVRSCIPASFLTVSSSPSLVLPCLASNKRE
jgi:hypothetical protein